MSDAAKRLAAEARQVLDTFSAANGAEASLIFRQMEYIATLRKALEPFAEGAEHLHPSQPDGGLTLDAIEVRHWRAAYAAYHEGEGR